VKRRLKAGGEVIKIKLIESMNPHWHDLAEQWSDAHKPALAADTHEIPRPAGENAGLRDDAFEIDSSIATLHQFVIGMAWGVAGLAYGCI
jgi:hypothetical protein